MMENLEALIARLCPVLRPSGPWSPGRTGERQAAVLVPLVEINGGPALLFIRRADGLDIHSGQVAFPGGNRDPEDAGPAATALRETHEEIGLAPDDVTVMGLLADVVTMTTGFRITAVVGRLAPGIVPRPDGREVAEAFTVPLARLRDPAVYREEQRVANGVPRRVPYFDVEPYVIWGATGRIVRQFLDTVAHLP